MGSPRSAPDWVRAGWSIGLALLFAVRLLSPAGFMPSFDHSTVAIVACPGFQSAAAPAGGHHGHGERGKTGQPCSYAAASASGLPALGDGFVTAALPASAEPAFDGGAAAVLAETRFLWPLPRGPPLPA